MIRLATKRAAKLLRRIEAAHRAGRVEEARALTRVYLKSFHARLAAADRANRKMRAAKRLTAERLVDVAGGVDAWSDEPMRATMHEVPKADGRTRSVVGFDFAARARQTLVADVLRANFVPHPGQAAVAGAGGGGGASRVLGEIERGARWVVKADVRDFFGTLDHAGLAQMLPLPARVTRNSVTTKRVRVVEHTAARTTRTNGRNGHPYTRRFRYGSGHITSLGLRGIPQGSGASAVAAEMVMSQVLGALPEGSVTWVDDVIVPAETRRAARDASQALYSAARRCPAGPLMLKWNTVRRVCDGFEFCGYHMRRRHGVVSAVPTSKNVAKVKRKAMLALVEDLEAERWEPEAVKAVYGRWSAAFPLWEIGDALVEPAVDGARRILRRYNPKPPPRMRHRPKLQSMVS